MVFAIVYLLFGHLPTIKAEVIEMEEFKEEVSTGGNNGLHLDTERSSVEQESESDRYKGDHKPVFNETVETLDEDQL